MGKTTDVWTTQNGVVYTFTWIRDDDVDKYNPVTQVYGVCFNDKGEILVHRDRGEDQSWAIPGGTPEPGEDVVTALKRELAEEVDVEVSECIPLGAQLVEVPNNPGRERVDSFYQLRYLCLISKILPLTVDPDKGRIHERKFVPMDQITDVVKWGRSGEALFKDAIEMYKSL